MDSRRITQLKAAHLLPQLVLGILLALAMPSANNAFAIAAVSPFMPCGDAFIESQNIDVLAGEVQGAGKEGGYGPANCASEALSRKGNEAVSVLLPLLESREPAVESLALNAVCGTGHRGEAALPYILDRIRKFDYAFSRSAYPVLACMKDVASPAIPLLVARSLQIIPGVPAQDGDAAIDTLARLAAVDPDTIISYLTQLLQLPIHTRAAAKGLEQIGDPARVSESALRDRLKLSIQRPEDAPTVAALISALTRLGDVRDDVTDFGSLLSGVYGGYAAAALGKIGSDARSVLPQLIRALNSAPIKSEDRYFYIDAVVSIDPTSLDVRRVLLREATRGPGGLSDITAASSLSSMDPLPAEFAPVLARRIERLGEHDAMRDLLRQALEHTHTGVSPGPSLPSQQAIAAPPYITTGLKSLARQPHVVTLRDAMIQLRLDPRYYEQNDSRSMTARWDAPGAQTVVANIGVGEVLLTSGYPPSGVSGLTQEVRVRLSKAYCVRSEPFGKSSLPRTQSGDIEVIGHRDSPAPPHFNYVGHLPNDRYAITATTIYLNSDCSSDVTISRSFQSHYWIDKCPFNYNRALVSDELIPALRRRVGIDFERYNLDKPQVEDAGSWLKLSFDAPAQSGNLADDNSLRLGLWIDRCSHKIESAWEY